MTTAIAMSGAIIESQDGSMMSYLSRCNYCMYVANSSTRTSVPMIGNQMNSNYHCPKCGKDTAIQIKAV